ncbi:MAG: hypothetical protein R2713_15150 [Ilumatobacteraceae bacterium]
MRTTWASSAAARSSARRGERHLHHLTGHRSDDHPAELDRIGAGPGDVVGDDLHHHPFARRCVGELGEQCRVRDLVEVAHGRTGVGACRAGEARDRRAWDRRARDRRATSTHMPINAARGCRRPRDRLASDTGLTARGVGDRDEW